MKVAGVVLAGGQSSRMGSDKSELTLKGKTLRQHSMEILRQAQIQNVFVSGKNGIVDKYANKGPLAGVLSCLLFLKQFRAVLFVPVDMPLLQKEILLDLQNNLIQDFCCFSDYNLPVILKNSSAVRDAIEQRIADNSLSLHGLYSVLKGDYLSMTYNHDCFANANSPAQWRAIKSTLGLLE